MPITPASFPAPGAYWAPERTWLYNQLVHKIVGQMTNTGPPLTSRERKAWDWVALAEAKAIYPPRPGSMVQ